MRRLRRRPCSAPTWGALATLAIGSASADAPAPPDTSGWKCAQCPFLQGAEAQVEAGVEYASGANASYGRYTGLDRSGAYVDAGSSGQFRRADGTYVNFDLENLGLPSREGYANAGQEGRYDLRISYDGQPSRLYDTAVTPFQGAGSGLLELPANWVSAGSTAGMTQLRSNLSPIDLGYDRSTVSVLGKLFAGPSWTLFGEFERQEKDGTDLTSASFLTQAVQLPQPIDYVTNSIDAGAAWSGRRASLRFTYTGSWFEDGSDSLTFANPYLPIVPGSTQGQLAQPPGNNLQQLAASGNLQLPWFATTLSYTASLGRLLQNQAFLPISTLPGSGLPAPGSLNGDVHLSHYALGLASRPLSKLSIHGNATYDGRDDETTPITVDYIVTDTFPGGTAVTPRYSEDRVRLDGGADYALLHWVRLGIGGEYQNTHYGPGQVLTFLQDIRSWGRASIIPLDSLTFTLKGGDGLRKTSSYDTAALPPGENPLVRDSNFAPREQVFYSLTAAWSPTATLTWSLEGYFADDDYPLSPLGLRSEHERRISSTLAWTPRDSLSLYLDGGYQSLYDLQYGYVGPAAAPWQIEDAERFWNAGVGGKWVASQRWTLSLHGLHAPSYGTTDSALGGLAQSFPQNWSQLDSFHFTATYSRNAALQINIRYNFEKYDMNDWALDGIAPATVPNLLGMGLQPYHHNVSLFALTVRYQLAPAASSAPK
jgi:MtrB/PioB family decaheme-associated outer membrane protein